MLNNPKSRQTNIVTQELVNETLIYDLKINKAYCLNRTSTLVWQLSDGKNSVSDISRLISRKLKKTGSEELVWLALDGLKRNGLLDESAEFKIEYNGLTRRQMVKKAGLTSLILLPIVSSVVAPAAISAQSQTCFPLLKLNCVLSSDCCSGFCQPLTGLGNVCCVPTNTDPTPGFRCAPDVATCNAFALVNCCSGQANFGALSLCAGSPSSGDRDCTCLENSIGFIP